MLEQSFAQPPTHARARAERQEKRRRQERCLEAFGREIAWISVPVIREHVRAGARDEPVQRKHDDVDVIHLADERNEIGNEVERHDHVADRGTDEHFVDGRDALVGHQTPEQAEIRRDLPYRPQDRPLGAAARTAARSDALLRLFPVARRAAEYSRPPTFTFLETFRSETHAAPPVGSSSCDCAPLGGLAGADGTSAVPSGRSVGAARLAVRAATSITSDATDLPAAATPCNTPIALLSSPIVSAIPVAETRPARRLSSTPSANRCKTLGDCAVLCA